ncbi:UDP-N-acetylmuramoyl-L-alanine--D-glutamate ligase [Candidatus Berkelbacteria bacterium CG10_big_fil_rev_8_21_14_0_10_41_12]|uniref:UDP-N-acetylmuramoyl-L-alanine--D-glutamate ligase n=1 Tax=Candidatus Berkelbacteria bacterium CG10_big_fil_rev_8_21_14_0_10_41_12 TaxID=1974513 RepID=A0A2M6WWZ0_9BACT|nr:MAG: UDP-N-acetylmuramoyl-L-alanine--D-glutamate ligase [Candidatus Berkelbacteria bacterium CG10_big_fil_rev_8_21_14_0_10_41_12]
MNDKISLIRDKKIAILGYGIEGKSLSQFFDSKNIKYSIYDETEKGNSIVTGEFKKTLEDKYNIYYKSPGIKYERISQINRSKISNLTDLFLNIFPGKIIGITGTKGKSTTAKLIDCILKINNKKSFLVGNIGEFGLDKINDASASDYAVCEMSSFQLQFVKKSPDIAVILPVFEDHLDYHADIQEYISSKNNICKFQNKSQEIVLADNEGSQRATEGCLGRKVYFGENLDKPGCYLKGKDAVCELAGENRIFGQALSLSKAYKIPLIDILAAVCVAFVEDLEFDFKKISENFDKLPFRMQFLGKVHGANFYNDSSSTNPISTIEGIKLIDGDKYLIIGGLNKNLKFDNLLKNLENDSIKKIYLYGQMKDYIMDLSKEYKKVTDKIIVYETLEEVFDGVKKNLYKGLNIIFSPAAASFDQFKNAKERGAIFNQLFDKLANAKI